MIRIDITPVPAPRQVRSDKWNPRPSVVRYRAFRDSMRAAGVTHLSGAVGVEFHLEMPDSWSEKKKAKMDGEPHQQKPDVDNLLKSVLDCVRSDAHVHTVAARKVWSRTAYILLEVDAQTC